MEPVVHAAIEEICGHGADGISLSELWPKLHRPLSAAGFPSPPHVFFKRAFWANLRDIPQIRFRLPGKDAELDGSDPEVQSVEHCEQLGFRIFADEELRDCFLGLYDGKSSGLNIPPVQQRVLERLAMARANGITQSQLSKELGMPGNNFFYVVKSLESRGLVVRRPTIVRTKDTSSDTTVKLSQPVSTNLIFLHRYAAPLGSQQRLEITKENRNGEEDAAGVPHGLNGESGECNQDDVLVKDFLPALKAVCDKLEQADGKVLVVADIKVDLGYRGTPGHRAWRHISKKLQQAGLVELFDAVLDNKSATVKKKRPRKTPVSCIRLVKGFSPKFFESRVEGNDDAEPEQLASLRRGQTEQFVELPIEHQIFDMVDAEGPKGLAVFELCRRLGISNKKNHNRIVAMSSRFGLHQLPESHKKGTIYRCWTPRNFDPQPLNYFKKRAEDVSGENENTFPPGNPASVERSIETTSDADFSVSVTDCTTPEHEGKKVDERPSSGPLEDERAGQMLETVPGDLASTVPAEDCSLAETIGPDGTSIEESKCNLPKSLRNQPRSRYPSLTSSHREQRIFERLKAEKFIIKAELQRWLEDLEDRHTKIDRKTLTRCLVNLEKEGHCRVATLSFPGLTNYDHDRDCHPPRTVHVVLHSSVSSSIHDLSDQIYEKLRSFELHVRQSSYRSKNEHSVPILTSVQKLKPSSTVDASNAKLEGYNGSILPKMVRVRLLHSFLWSYLNSPDKNQPSSAKEHLSLSRNPHSTCKLFALEEAMKATPVELFLQVVGSSHMHEGIKEKYKIGALLSDLPHDECKHVMNTGAMGRLSRAIDILRRLKLIRMVTDGNPSDGTKIQPTILTHALELKPYVEEPQFIDPIAEGSGSVDLRPQFRHDFVLLTKEALEEYWQTLEYCYAAADQKAALHAFPGSAVHELLDLPRSPRVFGLHNQFQNKGLELYLTDTGLVQGYCVEVFNSSLLTMLHDNGKKKGAHEALFLSRSWTRVKVMAPEHRSELIKCILKNDQYAKLTFKECKEIANDLKLSLAQVLRVYYDKQLRNPNRLRGVLNPNYQKSTSAKARHQSSLNKRKSYSVSKSLKRRKVDQSRKCLEDHDGANERPEGASTSRTAMPYLNRMRSPKFLWNDEADKQVLIQYARERAIQGAKGLRDWASITDLPAPPTCCRRRISSLKQDVNLRKALMRLCNLLTERYAQQLDKGQQANSSSSVEHDRDEDHQKDRWDNFEDDKIKMAFNEVLSCKQKMKNAAKETSSIPKDTNTHRTFSTTSEFDNNCRRKMSACRMSSDHRLPEKFVKHWEEGLNIAEEAHNSVAVANAIELFKLIFLSKSTSSEAPNLLAETLRCYSEHDLFSAFNYLRQKRIMVKSGGSYPYVLSQHFLRGLSLSQFPTNTGKRADKFASWIHEREKELMDGDVTISADLECGEIFHLLALVSCGEITMSPLLPDKGVGEAEDTRNLKHGNASSEIRTNDAKKKRKLLSLQESEICSRREKGFPGIKVSISRATIPTPDMVEFFKDENIDSFLSSESKQFYTKLGQQIHSSVPKVDCMEEVPDFGSIAIEAAPSGESKWEMMTNFAKQVLRLSNEEQHNWLHPSLFQRITKAIQKAGDQGLSMMEVSELICMPGKSKVEDIIDVLSAFGMAFKVNGYDSFHVVHPLYRSKYFLNLKASSSDDREICAASASCQIIRDHTSIAKDLECGRSEVRRPQKGKKVDEVHKVTILNLSEEAEEQMDKIPHHSGIGECGQSEQLHDGSGDENEDINLSSGDLRPILPWINGDGTINGIVYKGLRRRILGTVMQNPGILEHDLIRQMDVINPQSCRHLLNLMILENHITVRKMHQMTSSGPPSLLRGLCGSRAEKPKLVFRDHLFANPLSTSLL